MLFFFIYQNNMIEVFFNDATFLYIINLVHEDFMSLPNENENKKKLKGSAFMKSHYYSKIYNKIFFAQ